jgi:hypothetical protein
MKGKVVKNFKSRYLKPKDMYSFKNDFLYPCFCGAVIAAFLCVYAVFPMLEPYVNYHPSYESFHAGSKAPVPQAHFEEFVAEAEIDEIIPKIPVKVLWYSPDQKAAIASWHVRKADEKEDTILQFYRDDATKAQVVDFFGGLTHSEDIAKTILINADSYDIPPSLAFALCWEESQFNPQAINRKNRNESVDRGLFQLNSQSFPTLAELDFFNPQTNAHYGMAHLRWCLDSGGSVVAGVAMYNAGTNRVHSGSTPKKTLDYVSHILENQDTIERLFAMAEMRFLEDLEFMPEHLQELMPEPLLNQAEIALEPEPAKSRLALLSPISGRP